MSRVNNIIGQFECQKKVERSHSDRPPPVSAKPVSAKPKTSFNNGRPPNTGKTNLEFMCQSNADAIFDKRNDNSKENTRKISNAKSKFESSNFHSGEPKMVDETSSSPPPVPKRPFSNPASVSSNRIKISEEHEKDRKSLNLRNNPSDAEINLEQNSYVEMNISNLVNVSLKALPSDQLRKEEDVDYICTENSWPKLSQSNLSIKENDFMERLTPNLASSPNLSRKEKDFIERRTPNLAPSPNPVPPPLPSRNKKVASVPLNTNNLDDNYEIPEFEASSDSLNTQRAKRNQDILSSGLDLPPTPDKRLKNNKSPKPPPVPEIPDIDPYDALEDEDKDCLSSRSWYCDGDRSKVDRLLRSSGVEKSFLVRPGNHSPYVLCVFVNGQVKNIKLRVKTNSCNEQQWAVGEQKDSERTFASVIDLLDFHLTNGLKITGIDVPVYLKEFSFKY